MGYTPFGFGIVLIDVLYQGLKDREWIWFSDGGFGDYEIIDHGELFKFGLPILAICPNGENYWYCKEEIIRKKIFFTGMSTTGLIGCYGGFIPHEAIIKEDI